MLNIFVNCVDCCILINLLIRIKCFVELIGKNLVIFLIIFKIIVLKIFNIMDFFFVGNDYCLIILIYKDLWLFLMVGILIL